MILWSIGVGMGVVVIRQSLRRPALASILPKYGYGLNTKQSPYERLRQIIEQRFAVSSTELK